jgi:enoyl-CoA hydratase
LRRPEIDVELREHVALLTLNAPERRNALSVSMSDELVTACDWLDANEDVGAVVIRGAGGVFCAGTDHRLLADAAQDPVESGRFEAIRRIYRSFYRLTQLRAPTVAAVRGAADGANMNLALAADVRIVAEDTRISSGFVQIALLPGGGHFGLLARLLGAEAAAALGVFGDAIDGRRAREIGIAWEAVPDLEVEERAMRLARIAAKDPVLARAAVATMRDATRTALPRSVGFRAERAAQTWSTGGPHHAEDPPG